MKQPNTAGLVKPVQIRLTPETHQWIKEKSEKQDRSANYVINAILETAQTNERTQQAQPQGAQA